MRRTDGGRKNESLKRKLKHKELKSSDSVKKRLPGLEPINNELGKSVLSANGKRLSVSESETKGFNENKHKKTNKNGKKRPAKTENQSLSRSGRNPTNNKITNANRRTNAKSNKPQTPTIHTPPTPHGKLPSSNGTSNTPPPFKPGPNSRASQNPRLANVPVKESAPSGGQIDFCGRVNVRFERRFGRSISIRSRLK